MTHLTVSVLGDFQVLIDGVPISSFKSEKVRALLAFLAVEADHSHRRETLIGLLWPDYPELDARHSLRQALFNLRMAIGDHTARPPYLLISRDSIQFNRESDYSLDLDQFNAYYSAWNKNGSRESAASATLLHPSDEMIRLYRGEFLQHFFLNDSAEFEAWVLIQREALHQHMMEALICLANDYEQLGDLQTARRYVMRQLELDPWREEAHCQMMRVLEQEGQRSAALAQYEICQKILAEELGVEPSKKTREVYEQICSGTLKRKAEPPSYTPATCLKNLPVSPTPFIGRKQELSELSRLIADPECRCITLVGEGGIGKTRLALQAAEHHWKAFAHGTAFIPLASVGSIEAVIPAIADAIHFEFYGPTEPKIQLLNFLREKQMLLVLDNAESLLVGQPPHETIADLLVEILHQAAAIKLLVTSREALNLQEEWSFEVHGLAFPGEEQRDQWSDFDAVTLFVQRARRVRSGWVISAKDKTGIINLCRMVEGMPLAIELAATWVRLLSPSEIVQEIAGSLDILNTQMRDVAERHRSMRAVFDHSWQALSIEEKQVLSRLSVFRGGFQRQAAEQIANSTLSSLSSLMTRSLLRRTSTGRYDLHELIRQYAAQKLKDDAFELQTVQEQHSLYYLCLLEEKDAQLRSLRQKDALAELTLEIDNIRAAWNWSATHRKFLPLDRASIALWDFYELRNWFQEGEDIFEKTFEALQAYPPDNPDQTAIATSMLNQSASFKFRLGRSEEAYHILLPGVTFLRTTNNHTATMFSLAYIGITCWELGRFTEAKEYLQESLQLAQDHGRCWIEAISYEFLGIVSHDQGDYHQAHEYLVNALVKIRQLGDPSMTAHILSYLGRTLQVLGEYPEAEKLIREGLRLTREMDYRFGTGLALDALGLMASAQGRMEEAATDFSESADLFRDLGDTHRLSRTLNHQGVNLLSLGRITEARSAFIAAMGLAHEGGLIPSALNALTGLAAIETSQKPCQKTLELVIEILQHPSSNKEAKDLANQLRMKLESKLTLEEIETAKAHAGSNNLDELSRPILERIGAFI